ncbi:hypothetical protein K2224_17050 [Streptomyces sp. BHT-5-2]|uniref:hypothetical protein n=1 Tax=Streptomyces sp. BHT-5-2 TaxID=2866715 RepID=UPI001C8D899D|nr:hypothetical protein [Streptomyces sp. BHT-5-2]QZL04645.1 hypothetical protein K2224_17050 [Streptomyces sp. BHT-5-2]
MQGRDEELRRIELLLADALRGRSGARRPFAVPAAARGEEDRTRELAHRALEYTRPRGVGRGTSDALWTLGLLDLGSGQAQRALDRREAAREAAGLPKPRNTPSPPSTCTRPTTASSGPAPSCRTASGCAGNAVCSMRANRCAPHWSTSTEWARSLGQGGPGPSGGRPAGTTTRRPPRTRRSRG